MPRKIVLLVEGEGDLEAVPVLAKKLWPKVAYRDVAPDPRPMRVGGYPQLCAHEYRKWRRLLAAAAKRPGFAGAILLIDGDAKKNADKSPFCAVTAARGLVAAAAESGAGELFSLCVVFANREYESWVLAAGPVLAGRVSSNELFKPGIEFPSDAEQSPRDAKGWLRTNLTRGYRERIDQKELTALFDAEILRHLRGSGSRSFQRLGHAVGEICAAVIDGQPVATPHIPAAD